MQQEQGTQNVDERQLFHGTTTEVAHSICKNNFDWRLCGVHGTVYGQGEFTFLVVGVLVNMYNIILCLLDGRGHTSPICRDEISLKVT